MTIRIGGIQMPAALEALGEYHYPDAEPLGYDGEGAPVMPRYLEARFEYPQGLRNEHFLWWVSTVIGGARSRTFTSFASNPTVTSNNIVFRNRLLEHQAYRRAVVHMPTGVTTRMGYRREGVTVRITGILE